MVQTYRQSTETEMTWCSVLFTSQYNGAAKVIDLIIIAQTLFFAFAEEKLTSCPVKLVVFEQKLKLSPRINQAMFLMRSGT